MFLDFTGPKDLRTRGTVVVVPGRGESPASYVRLGNRLAADSYRVRATPAPVIDETDVPGSLDHYASVLADAVKGIADGGPLTTPTVLIGADVGAAVVAALVSRFDANASWWPAGVVLAGLPGYAVPAAAAWDDELDVRTHCPVHRGVLSGDPAVRPGSLSVPVADALLDAAYATRPQVPTLVLTGANDPLADLDRLTLLAEQLPLARLSVVAGAYHDVLNDLQHRSVAAEIVVFLEALRAEPLLEPIVHVRRSAW